MLPVRPSTHSMLITEHNYFWLSSGIGCKLKYKIRWFTSLQSLGLGKLPVWEKVKFSFRKCILWAGLAAQIRPRPGTQLLHIPTHSRSIKEKPAPNFTADPATCRFQSSLILSGAGLSTAAGCPVGCVVEDRLWWCWGSSALLRVSVWWQQLNPTWPGLISALWVCRQFSIFYKFFKGYCWFKTTGSFSCNWIK